MSVASTREAERRAKLPVDNDERHGDGTVDDSRVDERVELGADLAEGVVHLEHTMHILNGCDVAIVPWSTGSTSCESNRSAPGSVESTRESGSPPDL